MAHARLGRRFRAHRLRADPEHPRPAARPERQITMNDTATALRITPADSSDLSTTRTSGPGVVEIRDLNFYYGKGHALKQVNMSVPSKCVTAIIGPSGCGKSTLLRTINRIYELY